MAFSAYRDTVIVNGKIIFVYGWRPPVVIQINERNDPIAEELILEKRWGTYKTGVLDAA